MNHLFSYAFRPLFFLAVLYGVLGIAWWGGAWAGHLPLPQLGGNAVAGSPVAGSPVAGNPVAGNPVFWHAHEMIFGFAAAAIGGFALTAVANWTRRPPVNGLPLIVLCGFWLLARVQGLIPGSNLLSMAVADLGFDLLLLGLMSREVIGGRSQRNYKLIALLALFTLANGGFYLALATGADFARQALWAGMWLVVLLLNLIGGRIIPAFTSNWLVNRTKLQQLPPPDRPPAFGSIDRFASLATLAFALVFVWNTQSLLTAVLGAVAAVGQLWRWSRWQFHRTLGDPMMWILHLGFFWLPVGMALLSLAALGLVPLSAGVHALMTGGATTMILAVASRAALGHSNRPLANHPLLTASYVGITVTALLRVLASLSSNPGIWMMLATVAWLATLTAFALRYTPILLGPPARAGNS